MIYAGSNPPKPLCTIPSLQAAAQNAATVQFHGAVHRVRDMGDFAFVIVRAEDGVFQCIWSRETAAFALDAIREEACVTFTGKARVEERAPLGFEIDLLEAAVLSTPAEIMPVAVNKGKIKANLDTLLNYRPATLRAPGNQARFRLQAGLGRAFREYLESMRFTEIHTPKIGAASAEGGANVFQMEYFGRKAFLAQSPQFYKQMMVPVFERVFEIGPVFRAEKHSTNRHINEYTSMDLEMGYIDSFYDIIETETGFLRYAMELLSREYAGELAALGVQLPSAEKIPCVRFHEAKQMVEEAYKRKMRNPNDLEPEEEILISQLFQEQYNSDFVFVTHYPTKKRPFYAMDDPADTDLTLSFDLLFRGMEITTGGQRIHDYGQQCEKMRAKGLDPADFEGYLMLHQYGIAPHGGLGIGLERLCAKLVGDDNVRLSTLFPRDINRLEP